MKKYPAAVQFSLYIAIVSFATALVIFTCYFFTGDSDFAFLGFLAALLFVVLNVIALIVLGIAVKIRAAEPKHGRFALLVQLANIPVALVLFWAGAHLLNIARVTFVNETGSVLQNVRVLGCEEKVIDQLDPGERELVWISIAHDCSLRLEYVQGDSTVNRSVYGYLSSGMGMVYTYKIDAHR